MPRSRHLVISSFQDKAISPREMQTYDRAQARNQPYFPEPITVPGNVATEKYATRIQFAKRAILSHTFTVIAASCVAQFAQSPLPEFYPALYLLGILILLNISRRTFETGHTESIFSLLGLVTSIPLWGWFARDLVSYGVPVWVIPLTSATMAVYSLICGRDYSFVAMGVFSFILGGLAILAANLTVLFPAVLTWEALAILVAYTTYVTYDLSMVMRRRRSSEWLSSQADLYRDLLNFLTYPLRVAIHWKSLRWFQ